MAEPAASADYRQWQEFGVGLQGRDSTLANAMSQCQLFGLSGSEAAAEALRVIAVVDRWQDHFKACGVTDADIDSLAWRIDGDELLAQRRAFGISDHPVAAPSKRRGPFR